MRYQQATKIVAWIQLVSSTLGLLVLVFGLHLLIQNDPTYLEAFKDIYPSRVIGDFIINANAGQKIALTMPSILASIADIILGRYLLNAAKELNYKKLRTWFIITATETVICGVFSVFGFVAFGVSTSSIPVVLMVIAGFGYAGVSLFIVSLLREEIKRQSLPVKQKMPPAGPGTKQKTAGNKQQQRQSHKQKNGGGGGKYQPQLNEKQAGLYPVLNNGNINP